MTRALAQCAYGKFRVPLREVDHELDFFASHDRSLDADTRCPGFGHDGRLTRATDAMRLIGLREQSKTR